MDIRTVECLEIREEVEWPDWLRGGSKTLPARLALLDDHREEIDSISLEELAEALRPYLFKGMT